MKTKAELERKRIILIKEELVICPKCRQSPLGREIDINEAQLEQTNGFLELIENRLEKRLIKVDGDEDDYTVNVLLELKSAIEGKK